MKKLLREALAARRREAKEQVWAFYDKAIAQAEMDYEEAKYKAWVARCEALIQIDKEIKHVEWTGFWGVIAIAALTYKLIGG